MVGGDVMQIEIMDSRIQPDMLRPATIGSAAIDLRYCGDDVIELYPMQQVVVGTGIAIAIKDTQVAYVFPRSGLGSKGLVLGNTVGVIDSDYRKEIKAILLNRNREGVPMIIQPLDRIAQLVVQSIERPMWSVVKEIEKTTRGGLGSTGR